MALSASSSSKQSAIREFRQIHRVVVKVGTGVLTDQTGEQRLDRNAMAELVRQIAEARQGSGVQVLLVTSGAIAAGREVLRQKAGGGGRDIVTRQVLAAAGQGPLMNSYQELFMGYGIRTAQTLLTINDLSNRLSYLNVRNTLMALLELGVVPVINENDVVAVDEIGEVFGDNDRLSALVATLVDADLLLILTDTEGLFTADPRTTPEAELLPVVEQVDATVEAMAGTHKNPWARGGMPTKIEAAKLVTSGGIGMVMCNGRAEGAILRALRGDEIGTWFRPVTARMEARKRWMLSRVLDSGWGEVIVDAGAAKALAERSVSLLPAGVKRAAGEFHRGDIVYISGESGERVACGIANYSAEDIARISGLRSDHIPGVLGYHYGQEVVHRNNLVLL